MISRWGSNSNVAYYNNAMLQKQFTIQTSSQNFSIIFMEFNCLNCIRAASPILRVNIGQGKVFFKVFYIASASFPILSLLGSSSVNATLFLGHLNSTLYYTSGCAPSIYGLTIGERCLDKK